MKTVPQPSIKPSMVAHTANLGFKGPVTRVKTRVTRSAGVRRRDMAAERARADDLDFEQLDWFIVEVKSGKEDTARLVARAKGFGTCLPMRSAMSRKGRHAPSTLRAYPVLSGYLFVGMSPATPGWPELMAPSFMLGVVGINDRPYRLDKAVIDRFLERYESDFYQRRAGPPAPPPPDFKVGDHVRVLCGPFDNHVFPIRKMKQEQAVIVAHVLGKDCEIAIRLDDLCKSA